MVAKITPPKNSIGLITSVLENRVHYRDFYKKLKHDLINQVIAYEEFQGDPSVITSLDLSKYTSNDEEANARRKSLLNLYKLKDEEPYETLEKMRRGHGLRFCPSCGDHCTPGTLDHYLPKSEFPELAICLVNLTPMCNTCQEEKSADYKTANGTKAFLHPYYDDITECLFHVEIDPPFNAPKFNVVVKDTIPPGLKQLVESHIKGINFKFRFEKQCEEYHIDLLGQINEERSYNNAPTAKKVIEQNYRKERRKNINAWEAIYYQSVLNTPMLLAYLDNDILPGYT